MGRPTPTRPQKPLPKAVMAALLKVEDLLWNAEQSVAEANEVAFAHRELINEHIRVSLVLASVNSARLAARKLREASHAVLRVVRLPNAR